MRLQLLAPTTTSYRQLDVMLAELYFPMINEQSSHYPKHTVSR